MKRLYFILLILLYPFVGFSAINECKTDVYFANGILATPEQAFNNAEYVLKPAIIVKFGIDYYNNHIGEVGYAYNDTFGFWQDIFESGLQIANIQEYIDWWATKLPGYKKSVHEANIETQVDTYEASIKAGHRVLVVAHSQGNLFAQEAYERLGEKFKGQVSNIKYVIL